MESPATMPSPYAVTVHPFSSPTRNSCAFERGNAASASNALVFIGGLTAGPQFADLASVVDALEGTGYAVWEFRMRSSYSGFGYSSLANDVEDTSALVKYLRGIGKEKIVLVGMSTGCQDCMEYTDHGKYNNPPVDGYVLTSPVSDREAAGQFMPPDLLNETIRVAQEMISKGLQNDAMPSTSIPPIFGTPVTAYRWNSLAAKCGDDDYFSSDLPGERLAATFGRIDKPILFLPAGEDESVPPSVDQKARLAKWATFCKPGVVSELSGLIPGAGHEVLQPEAQKWWANTIVKFLKTL